jgi:dTDP-4-amino-4,6-dideoxygalactose transaminase
MKEIPAILGGKPKFTQMIQMVRPVLPSFDEMADGIQNILSTGMVTKGNYMRTFEKEIAEHLNVRHAVAVSSCTSGMMLTHKAFELTGEVIVPSFTFMATVSALVWAGLHPIFADVDRATNNLDPDAIEPLISKKTSAIVAVHQFGNPAAINELHKLAISHGIKLIFDAAHGFGALYQGEPVGNQGDAQIFSLSPTKLLTSGEGGIVATNDDELAEKIQMGREYGNDGNYDSAFAGLNARMPELSALLGLKSLPNLENSARHRNEIVAIFQEFMGILPGIGFQQVHQGDRHSYREFSITIDPITYRLSRDELATALKAENIDTRKYYSPPIHKQTAYRMFDNGDPLPNTNWLSTHSLSFPLWSNMSAEIAMSIGTAVQQIHENATLIHQELSKKK